jgi:hypothetical protein
VQRARTEDVPETLRNSMHLGLHESCHRLHQAIQPLPPFAFVEQVDTDPQRRS